MKRKKLLKKIKRIKKLRDEYKFTTLMMKTAYAWADESKCERGKVGAVIYKKNNLISAGTNGTPSGFKCNDCKLECEDHLNICPHCYSDNIKLVVQEDSFNDRIHYFECKDCEKIFDEPKVTIKTDHTRVIHAEPNALMYAAKMGHSVKNATIAVTLSPCKNCSLLIAQSGIKRVIYDTKYRITDGLDMLKELGVEVLTTSEAVEKFIKYDEKYKKLLNKYNS